MSAIVHTFPSFHGFNSRSGFLALIVVLHVVFFWALTAGLSHRILINLRPLTELVPVQLSEPAEPEPVPLVDKSVGLTPVDIDTQPLPRIPYEVVEPTDGPGELLIGFPELPTMNAHETTPIVAEPQIDTQRGLREPMYPATEIRLGHTGTVVLSVEVLSNGRVGEVRIVQSSGYVRLDQAAMKAARDWRLIPGTRDGVPAPMWKDIPITFRLEQ